MDSHPPDSAVDISVLVPVLNEGRHVRETVRAMQEQRFDGRIEFLFADGASTDDTKAVLQELAREDDRIVVLDNPARTTPAGLNVCLAHARGEFAARMDAHTLYPTDYLAVGVERLREGGAAWVAGPQVAEARGPVSRGVALGLRSWLGRGASRRWGHTDADGEYELDTGVFTGVWRRETLLRFGGWDERWPINQDAEMAARFLERDERIVGVPAMAARYFPRESWGSLARQYRRYGTYRALTALHHPTSLRPTNLLSPGLALAAICALGGPRPLRGLARAGLGGYGMALAVASARPLVEEGPGALAMPAALATMHLSYGFGFLAGCVRFGVPVQALVHASPLSPDGAGPTHQPPVHAPSLRAPAQAVGR
jgi:GT2 family glycosyltransferase